MRGRGTYLRAGGRPALVLTDDGAGSSKGYRWKARLVGRSDGGYNVGHGSTPREAIRDLTRCYERCIEAVEDGRKELEKVGAL